MFAVIKSKKEEGINLGVWAGVDFNNLVELIGLGETQDLARITAIECLESATFNGVDSYIEVAETDPRVNAFVELSPELAQHYRNALAYFVFDQNDESEAAISALVDMRFWQTIIQFLFVGDDGKLTYTILTGDNFPYGAKLTSDEELKESLLLATRNLIASRGDNYDYFDTF